MRSLQISLFLYCCSQNMVIIHIQLVFLDSLLAFHSLTKRAWTSDLQEESRSQVTSGKKELKTRMNLCSAHNLCSLLQLMSQLQKMSDDNQKSNKDCVFLAEGILLQSHLCCWSLLSVSHQQRSPASCPLSWCLQSLAPSLPDTTVPK